MKTLTLAVPTVGATPRPRAALRWQPSSAPTGLYGLGTGVSGAAGVDCAPVHGNAGALAPVAAVELAALPFVALPSDVDAASAMPFTATTVGTDMAVAGNQQVAVAPKQAEKPVSTPAMDTLVNFMRENASPSGNRAGAPPS